MIVGIDPSLSNTAIVIGNEKEVFEKKCFTSKNLGSHVPGRIQRFDDLVYSIIDYLGNKKIDSIFIEGYAIYQRHVGMVSLIELGGILRLNLFAICERIFEVTPTSLKKFATSRGSSKKSIVCAEIASRYGVNFDNDDLYDAFALYQLGLCCEDIEKPETAIQADVVHSVIKLFNSKGKK